ncbi:MAG: peptide deformylase [Hyphomicrobiaceae bacterium]
MSLLPIITLPDPVLRQKSTPVERVDDALRRTLDDMLETMYEAPGVGLAANQVNIAKRFIVVDASNNRDDDDEAARNPMCLINPEIVARSDSMGSYEEGCLSLPDVRVEIERPDAVTVRYLDREGVQQEIEAQGFLATVIQHEIDHLDGRLIIDFLSSLRRDMIVRRFKKLARQA